MPADRSRRRISALPLTWVLGSPARALPPLQLVSGHLPPFAIESANGPRGALVEVAEAVLARAGWPQRTRFYPWARAVLMASTTPRTLIQPLTRTPEREAQFQWLLRIYVQHFGFMTLAEQAPVRELEQAKQLRVGVLRGSPHRARLRHHGFNEGQLREAASVDDLHRMLELKMIDAVYGGTLINIGHARDSGRPAEWLRVGLVLESGDIWLAASSGVSAAEQQSLLDAQQALQADGTIARLLKGYGL